MPTGRKPKTQNKISVVKPTKKARISGPTVKPKGTPTMRSKQHSALPGNTASAKVIRDVVNMLSRLPGGSDAANKNMRRSVNAAYNRTRAEQGAKAAGNSAASQRAVNRAKTRQVAPRRKKK